MQNNTAISTNVSIEITQSNIIKFPLRNRSSFTTDDLEELREQALQNKIEFITLIAGELMDEVFFKVNMLGFNFDPDADIKDCVLVVESLKSLMLKNMGIAHDLQVTAEKIIDFADIADIEEYED